MASKDNVAFVLVPGSFAGPIFYHKVTDVLESKGYTAVPITLPSAGDVPKQPASMYDDADIIRNAILERLDSGKDVVLAMNSYGGIPGSQSLKGLSRAERGEGKTAVIGLVYIAAMLVLEGVSSDSRNAEEGVQGPQGHSEEDPYMHLPAAEVMAPLVFSDLPESEYMKYYNTMPSQSKVSFADKLTYGGYRSIPALYILPDGDMIIKPELQHKMVNMVNETLDSGRQIRMVDFPGASHVPMLSQPEEVVRVLLEAAELDRK